MSLRLLGRMSVRDVCNYERCIQRQRIVNSVKDTSVLRSNIGVDAANITRRSLQNPSRSEVLSEVAAFSPRLASTCAFSKFPIRDRIQVSTGVNGHRRTSRRNSRYLFARSNRAPVAQCALVSRSINRA